MKSSCGGDIYINSKRDELYGKLLKNYGNCPFMRRYFCAVLICSSNTCDIENRIFSHLCQNCFSIYDGTDAVYSSKKKKRKGSDILIIQRKCLSCGYIAKTEKVVPQRQKRRENKMREYPKERGKRKILDTRPKKPPEHGSMGTKRMKGTVRILKEIAKANVESTRKSKSEDGSLYGFLQSF